MYIYIYIFYYIFYYIYIPEGTYTKILRFTFGWELGEIYFLSAYFTFSTVSMCFVKLFFYADKREKEHLPCRPIKPEHFLPVQLLCTDRLLPPHQPTGWVRTWAGPWVSGKPLGPVKIYTGSHGSSRMKRWCSPVEACLRARLFQVLVTTGHSLQADQQYLVVDVTGRCAMTGQIQSLPFVQLANTASRAGPIWKGIRHKSAGASSPHGPLSPGFGPKHEPGQAKCHRPPFLPLTPGVQPHQVPAVLESHLCKAPLYAGW